MEKSYTSDHAGKTIDSERILSFIEVESSAEVHVIVVLGQIPTK